MEWFLWLGLVTQVQLLLTTSQAKQLDQFYNRTNLIYLVFVCPAHTVNNSVNIIVIKFC